MLRVPDSHANVNIIFYYVRDTLYIVGVCEVGISTTNMQKRLCTKKYETCSCMNSMQVIYYIIFSGIFTAIGGYKCGVINNR